MKGLVHLVIYLLLSAVVYAQRDCGQTELEGKLSFEAAGKVFKPTHLLSGINNKETAIPVPDVIVIPVVVHVLYQKPNEKFNISDAQVISQIESLNRDFRGKNTDRSKTPDYFSGLAADCGIEFALAKVDQNGFPTTGIVRKQSDKGNFGRMSDNARSTAHGGDDPWDPNSYLNIWVCNLAELGYSSFPTDAKNKDGAIIKDGVVINASCFGTTGSLNGNYNLGRTATHEIGHWLNLLHIWGNDKIEDTPEQRSATSGCPSGKKFSCGKDCEKSIYGDMYMNYMDYTNDACMNLFTRGQKEIMRSMFAEGAPRRKLLFSKALDTTAIVIKNTDPQLSGIAAAQVSMFPNPATGFLNIQLNNVPKESSVNKSLTIFDRFGNAILRDVMQSSQKTISINNLKPGLYYLHLVEGSAKSVVKFIKL